MNYDRYYTCDVVNGEGLRVTLFVTGCQHACPGCYNSSTWNRMHGKPFTAEVRDRLLDLCDGHDGLSLSGGDPLLPANRDAIAALCRAFKLRYPDKDIWMWTGYVYEDIRHLELLRDVQRAHRRPVSEGSAPHIALARLRQSASDSPAKWRAHGLNATVSSATDNARRRS
ncbi:MAG: anaerobic ribonucleoside-triphosphate reductase activating protein [Rhodocyclaceae bacterium]